MTPSARRPAGARENLRSRARSASSLAAQLSLLVAAICAALLVRTLVIEPYQIGSDSMWPTLEAGDHLFVAKLLYGAQLEAFDARLPALREPERGEVVVFDIAREAGTAAAADLRPDLPRERVVKRIVGLPGDRVESRGGALYVNGRQLESWDADAPGLSPHPDRLRQQRERLGEREHALAVANNGVGPDFAVLVPTGRYFLLSDNRASASDSRLFGSVRREELLGPAVLVYWSWQRGARERTADARSAAALSLPRPRWSRAPRWIE